MLPFLFIKFPILEHFCIGNLSHNLTRRDMKFIFLHDYQIAIWDLIHYFVIGKMKRIHKRGDLPEKTVVPYNLCLAVRLTIFPPKLDSLIKFSTEISE